MLFNGIIIQNITDEAYDEYDDYDVGMNINQLNAALLKRGIKPPAEFTDIFSELDTNKNGLLQKSEVNSATEAEEGQDYCDPLICMLFGGLISIISSIITGMAVPAINNAISGDIFK